ncbi:MAG TPA: cysteine peptidase family C39 domain-containing protein, partial [Sphingobacteriaceae bacterium]
MLKKFPFYKQLDQMDCGPTCLRMVAKYYGKNYPLTFLRDSTFISREGVSLLGISEAAEKIGFRTMGVKLPFKRFMTDAPLPCIVHWNQSHFAVVYKVSKHNVWVADPASGHIKYSVDEFTKSWHSTVEAGTATGVALILEPTPKFYDRDDELTRSK